MQDITINEKIYTVNRIKNLDLDTVDDFLQPVFSFYKEWLNDSDYFETNTSGSTGLPKTIRIKKKHAQASAEATLSFFNLKQGDTVLLCMNPNFIGGKMMLLRALLGGLNIDIIPPVANPFTNIEKAYDFVPLVPLQVQSIIDETPHSFNHIKTVIIGGGATSKALENNLKKFSCQFYSTFGMTETISHIALKELNKAEYYNCLPGITVSAPNKQLIIHAPKLGQDNLVTNDTVDLLSDTQFVWKGRADFVINSGGVKIHPELVEEKLSTYISTPFIISKKKDERLGEKVVLIIEDPSKTEITIDFKSVLEKYEAPKEIIYVDALPKTASGKLLRNVQF